MDIMRKRGYYVILVFGVIVLGLLSREVPGVSKWVGDALWGLMVFFLSGVIFTRRTSGHNAALSAVFAIGVEAAKLYHTPWLDEFRCTIIGGLLLGHVFSWQNILCYLTGIAVGVICEELWFKRACYCGK